MTITTNHNRHDWRQYIDRAAAADAETIMHSSLLLIRWSISRVWTPEAG